MDEQVNLTDRQKNLQEKNEMVITEGSSREDIELEKGSVNSFDFTEVKNIINEHFAIIKGLVRYSKEKDANVLTLSKSIRIKPQRVILFVSHPDIPYVSIVYRE